MKLLTLKKRYPKAFAKFEKGYDYSNVLDYNIREWWSDITDFMDKQGITICIKIYTTNNCFYYEIYFNKKGYEFESLFISDDKRSRKYIETKAIAKAFKILNDKLIKKEAKK